MGIISVSLDEGNLAALDAIKDRYGLGGRSEAVRAAISAAMSEIKDDESLEGTVEGVLVIVRRNHDDPWMIRLQARYEHCIKTQLHSHLRDHKCLEVMVVSCEAADLGEMMREIRSEGKADYVRFVRGRGPRACSQGSREPS